MIDNERRDAFEWLATATLQLRASADIEDPAVIITDHCKEIKAALNDVFPVSQQQLYIFHIMKNVMLNSKKKFRTGTAVDSDDEEEGEYNNDGGNGDGNEVTLDAEEHTALARLRNINTTHNPEPGIDPQAPPIITHDYKGVVSLFRAMVFADTDDFFFKA